MFRLFDTIHDRSATHADKRAVKQKHTRRRRQSKESRPVNFEERQRCCVDIGEGREN